ncbi:uncharacterized protein [Temnothorax nylanderi]|uniref:uncharacterized protein n=1 Tax=Temnothorax nylanderi TaxID=102681 RepID=UPI003A84E253
MCIKKLGLVDDTLEGLGTPKEYRRIKKSIIWALSIYLIVILTVSTTDSIWNVEKHNTIKAMIIPLVLGYPFHVNTLGDIMFAFILRYIGTRLDKINNYIEQLSGTEEYGLRCKWEKSFIIRHVQSNENRKHVLWTVMHLHSELCRVARNINDLFATQLTLQMISYFVILIVSFYVQYHMMLCLKQIYGSDSAKLKLVLANDMWCMIFLTKFISLNHICESVSAKVEKTKALTHKLTNLIRFTETRREIYQFLLQISLRPMEFCGMGMFYFGYKFIYKFFMWILTVIIFILQMDTSPMSRILISDRINVTCFDRDV